MFPCTPPPFCRVGHASAVARWCPLYQGMQGSNPRTLLFAVAIFFPSFLAAFTCSSSSLGLGSKLDLSSFFFLLLV